MERSPELEIPSHDVITAIGTINANWFNSTLIRHYDPYENYLEYNDGDTLHKLNLLESDWDKLMESNFPWEYWPDLNNDSTCIVANIRTSTIKFNSNNTRLRLYPTPEHNHIEHYFDGKKRTRYTADSNLWRELFEGEFPIKYLPYIEPEVQQWLKG